MDVHTLTAALPVPSDDGATDHLRGAVVPPLVLPVTSRRLVDLAGVAQGGEHATSITSSAPA